MRTSDAGIDMIKSFEGFRPTVYRDPAGHRTIGYGHRLKPDESMDSITESEALALLRSDLRQFEDAVNRMVRVPIHQAQFDALVSFAYNLGNSALASSTLLRKVNSKDYDVSDEFRRWNKARNPRTGQLEPLAGLTQRREAEAAMWRTGQQLLALQDPILPTGKQAGGAVGLAAIFVPVLALFFGYQFWMIRKGE